MNPSPTASRTSRACRSCGRSASRSSRPAQPARGDTAIILHCHRLSLVVIGHHRLIGWHWLSLAVIGCHPLGIYILVLILLSLLSIFVNMTVSPRHNVPDDGAPAPSRHQLSQHEEGPGCPDQRHHRRRKRVHRCACTKRMPKVTMTAPTARSDLAPGNTVILTENDSNDNHVMTIAYVLHVAIVWDVCKHDLCDNMQYVSDPLGVPVNDVSSH
jgi:hypothetical protein